MESIGSAFSYTDYGLIDSAGHEMGIRQAPSRVNYSQLLKNCVIGCSTVIYDTHDMGKQYFPEIRKRQDFALWLRLLKEVKYASKCGGVLTRYRVRSDSISANKLSAAHYTWRVYREVEKLGLTKSLYYFVHYAISGVLKRV